MEKYMPDMYQKSIYTVDYQKLMDRGVKCVLFDLDNTLVPFHIKHSNDKIAELFNNLREKGLKVIIFSNYHFSQPTTKFKKNKKERKTV